MVYQHDTYDRRIQLGASRRRWEDAKALHEANRWAGAIYLAGYAIECSLCAYICYCETKTNLKDTRMYREGTQGASLHNLVHLLDKSPSLKRAIQLDRSGKYKHAWDTITSLWQKDELRYWDRVGNKDDCFRFIDAIQVIHRFIMERQGEAS